jgi:dienelactone hydrolase
LLGAHTRTPVQSPPDATRGTLPADMTTLDYRDGDLLCEAFVATPTATSGRKPAVLVAHAWAGQDDFARAQARMLAGLGYVGFAVDMYGKGRRGGTPEVNATLMQPFIEDRALLRRRIVAAANAAAAHPQVDGERLAAIGFCFGGMCVLDLARSGQHGVRGVVSFHGLLGAPGPGVGSPRSISSKVLVLHPYDDPMAPPESVAALAAELTAAKADWQVHMYGGTLHAFTNPEANDPGRGTVYNATAARRSFASMELFLKECLA